MQSIGLDGGGSFTVVIPEGNSQEKKDQIAKKNVVCLHT